MGHAFALPLTPAVRFNLAHASPDDVSDICRELAEIVCRGELEDAGHRVGVLRLMAVIHKEDGSEPVLYVEFEGG